MKTSFEKLIEKFEQEKYEQASEQYRGDFKRIKERKKAQRKMMCEMIAEIKASSPTAKIEDAITDEEIFSALQLAQRYLAAPVDKRLYRKLDEFPLEKLELLADFFRMAVWWRGGEGLFWGK